MRLELLDLMVVPEPLVGQELQGLLDHRALLDQLDELEQQAQMEDQVTTAVLDGLDLRATLEVLEKLEDQVLQVLLVPRASLDQQVRLVGQDLLELLE